MAYFNNTNNAGFWDTSASGGFDAYPFLNQTSATEEGVDGDRWDTFADRWGAPGEHGNMVGSSTSLPAAINHGECHCNPSANLPLTM